jgi:NAD(P)-dependent dehydrogenase (short-subunit alcohol dehydrogenase family)
VVGDILSATAEDFQLAFEGNTLASFYALQALIKSLIAQGNGGQILIGSSALGVRPYPAGTAYSATKAGAIMLVKNAALTAAPHGITVNSIGTMALNYSGFLDNSGARDPQVLGKILESIPAGRLGEVEEAAHLAASLLDGECSFMNGEFLSVSGGWTNV